MKMIVEGSHSTPTSLQNNLSLFSFKSFNISTQFTKYQN